MKTIFIQTKSQEVKMKADGTNVNNLSKQISTYTDNMGKATRETKMFNTETGEVTKITQRTSETILNSSKSLKDLALNFTDIIKKVTLFGGATAIIGLFTASIGEAGKTIKDFDDAITQYQKVSDLSGQSLETFSENLGKMGEDVARTRTQMIESATAWKQSGYSDEDSAKLAKISEMFRNISDAEISTPVS